VVGGGGGAVVAWHVGKLLCIVHNGLLCHDEDSLCNLSPLQLVDPCIHVLLRTTIKALRIYLETIGARPVQSIGSRLVVDIIPCDPSNVVGTTRISVHSHAACVASDTPPVLDHRRVTPRADAAS